MKPFAALSALVPALAILALAACSQPTATTTTPAGPPTPVAIDAHSGTYYLDKNHSSLTLRAIHFGLSHYTLRLTKWDATLTFNAEHPEQSGVTATADAHSVQTGYPGTRNFDAELENSQWLDADTHPELTFHSAAVTLTGPNIGRMTGDLTIRGVTKPASFDITFNQGYAQHPMGAAGAYLGFSAHGTFKRSDYGMIVLEPPAGAPGAGVSDDVEIVIEAEFIDHPPPATATN